MIQPSPSSRPRRWLRRLVVAGLLLLALPPLGWALWLQLAHRDVPPPTTEEIDRGLRQGLGWIRTHEAEVLGQGNAMLWRMLLDAAALNHDADLQRLLRAHRARYFPDPSRNAWQRLMYRDSTAAVDRWEMLDVMPYQRFFLYAISCDPALAGEPVVQAQLARGACRPAWLSPFGSDAACRTHQLMGLMLMREHGCGDKARVAELTAHAQDDIVRELQVDFRSRDPYVQRVLMLYWTGVPERVRPAWLRRVLQAQRPDGGWADRQPILELPGGRVLQFGGYAENHRLTLQPAQSDFHATAQGILLLSLVKAQQAGKR
ncbi:MAG: hypothetical protein EPO01_13960 [Aquabacterium sp.]|nr:MAG: hypothetical protein EPO01_13960 [Aquabacterium sp.]